ncbi:MAG: hypothetical protein ACRC26_06220 [Bacteroidales bacterium]
MKHKHLISFLSLFFLLTACDKEESMEWDMTPVELQISVVDQDYNDLLNPRNEYALDLTKIKGLHLEKEYSCKPMGENDVNTRYYLPTFYGLKQAKMEHENIYILRIGEFDGAVNFKDESFRILWEDGTSDTFTFNREVEKKKNDRRIKEELYHNGVKVSDNLRKVIRISKWIDKSETEE